MKFDKREITRYDVPDVETFRQGMKVFLIALFSQQFK